MNIAAKQALQSVLEPHLGAIADLLPSTYKVTLVARYEGSLDADIVLTNDPELPMAGAVLERFAAEKK